MIVRSDTDPNVYSWSSLDSGQYGGPSVLPPGTKGAERPPLGFRVPRVKPPVEDRLAFLRRRVDEIKARGYTKSDEVNLLSSWCDELLERLGSKTTLEGDGP